ncbi:alpha/beta hydrolase [Streptomyces sp. ms191]|uniref:alpha/beta hydrolase n=1 Tax=Streptomyces sp. ms191 TaxID=1827978 RepID=UPI0011CE6955|nr:alpha/beta hydrolase [Streptomyces sp. ms191]TXS29455.1 alpha/beta hydrolase [Streptomyces sp. ms191]
MSRFVRVGGVAHHVVVEGSGPVCVLSAGLAMCWFDWDPVVRLLAPHRTVVRFDRPGHGLSAPAAVPPSAAGEAHRIAGVLDALGLPGPATVVGHSIAGFHAEAHARLYPARTAGVVLVDSSVEDLALRSSFVEASRDALRALAGRLASEGFGELPVIVGYLDRSERDRPRLGRPAGSPENARRAGVRLSRPTGGDPAPAALVRSCYATTRVLRGALLENTHYRAVAAELLALRERFPLPRDLPVTVLAAPDGSARRDRRQRTLARRLGARYEAVEPSGHLMMLDRPDAVARAALRTGGQDEA